MKTQIKRFWGLAALVPFALCLASSVTARMVLGLRLRSVPACILIWLGAASISAFVVWFGVFAHRLDQARKRTWSAVWARIAFPVSAACIFFLFLISLLAASLAYRPEYLVERNGVQLVARVHSFLDEYVYYYQYKGFLFYGQKMGYEYYSGGGGDPLAKTPKPEPSQWAFYDLDGNVIESGSREESRQKAEETPLDIGVMENREDELVFTISISDFIDSYNSFYESSHDHGYLAPFTEWRSNTYSAAIHSNHETVCYNFTENEKMYPLPTVSVYVPSNGNYIQEVTVNFDEHSYQEAVYDLYEEMCFYTLKVFFPGLTDEEITELYTTLNQLAYDNISPSGEGYRSGSVPCALYYKDGIGLYPYFAIGEWMHLCVVPVTQETIDGFEQKGVAVYEIE